MNEGMAAVLIKQTIDTMMIVKRYKDVYENQYKGGVSRKRIYNALRTDFQDIAVRRQIGGDTYLFQEAKKIIKQHMDIVDQEQA